MNKNKFERIKNILYDYQDGYSFPEGNMWSEDQSRKEDALAELSGKLETSYREAVYSAQNLGFVQGMRFAYDTMEIIGDGRNKELLEKLLTAIESEEQI